jgi:hypothetical protein
MYIPIMIDPIAESSVNFSIVVINMGKDKQ